MGMWGNKLCRAWYVFWGKMVLCIASSNSVVLLSSCSGWGSQLLSVPAPCQSRCGSGQVLQAWAPCLASVVRVRYASLVGSLWCWVRPCSSTSGKYVGRNSLYKSTTDQWVKWASCNKLGGGWCFSSHVRVGRNSDFRDLKGKNIADTCFCGCSDSGSCLLFAVLLLLMHYLWDVWCICLLSLCRCIIVRCQTCCHLC